MSLSLYLNDTDVSRKLTSKYLPVRERPIYGQPAELPTTDIQVLNFQDEWSPLSPSSIVYGVPDLTAFQVTLWDGPAQLYSGRIIDITVGDDNTATLHCQTPLAIALQKPFIYNSGGTVNPADVVAHFTDLYNLILSPTSYSRTAPYLDSIGLDISSLVLVFTNVITDLFDAITGITCGSIYSDHDQIRYDVYQDLADETPVITFTSSQVAKVTLGSVPTIQKLEQAAVTGYEAQWSGGSFTIGNPLESLQTISGGPGGLVTLPTVQAAVAAGNQWLGFLNGQRYMCSFEVRMTYYSDLELGMVVAVENNISPGARSLVKLEITRLECVDPLTCVVSGLVIL